VSTRMVWQVPRSGSGKRRERVGCGAEGQHQRVPAVGRGTCLVKYRIRGEETGAEDEEVWWGRVRMQAGDGHAVTARRAVAMAGVVGLQAGRSWRWFMPLRHIRARHPLLKQLGWA
jgi:hypothetical protein